MDIKTLALITAVVLAATTIDPQSNSQFESFKADHSKLYSSETEEVYRQSVFQANLAKISEHNADEAQTYKMGVNQFSDFTQEEFEERVLMKENHFTTEQAIDDALWEGVSNVDWVSQGAVQRVKDQGNCGSCWAFSASSQAESEKFLRTGTLGAFSEQQLNSCDTSNGGCNGGFMKPAYTYWASAGICTESSYPYVSGNGSNPACRASSCTRDSFSISGFNSVSASTSSLQSACNSRPIAVAVDASNWSSYSSGIFSNCGTRLNHAVNLAGYTSSYWLVKNSWGSRWGESGYIRMAPGNTCGIANDCCYVRV